MDLTGLTREEIKSLLVAFKEIKHLKRSSTALRHLLLGNFSLAELNKLLLAVKQTDNICLAVVRLNGLALRFVENQTPGIIQAAMKQNKQALQAVAVRQDNLPLKFVEHHWSRPSAPDTK